MTRRRTRYRIIQKHHINYTPEITCLIFKGEHRIITELNRLTKSKPSMAFIQLAHDWCTQKFINGYYSEEEMRQIQKENQQKRLAAQKRRRRKN